MSLSDVEFFLFSDVFKAYDYGPQENIFRYNQMMPPVYDLSKVTTRVAILYGNGDAFANSLVG